MPPNFPPMTLPTVLTTKHCMEKDEEDDEPTFSVGGSFPYIRAFLPHVTEEQAIKLGVQLDNLMCDCQQMTDHEASEAEERLAWAERERKWWLKFYQLLHTPPVVF